MSTSPRHPVGAPASKGGQFKAQEYQADGVSLDAPASLADKRATRTLDSALDRCVNGLDQPLTVDTRVRLKALANHVTEERWEDGHGIMLQPNLTLWQALLRHTDYNQRTGTVTEMLDDGAEPFRPATHRVVSGWKQLPTADQVRQAILESVR